jgi:cytochrome oxidase Cu insertion factor (SCO1/SenC/PrrC family)
MLKTIAMCLCLAFVFVATVNGQRVRKPQDSRTSKPAELEVGDEAPDWELVGSNGKTYKLSDYKGKQAVVVAWYPAALTGG